MEGMRGDCTNSFLPHSSTEQPNGHNTLIAVKQAQRLSGRMYILYTDSIMGGQTLTHKVI